MLKEPTNCSWMCVGPQQVGWLVVLCVLVGAGCAAGHSRLDRPAWEQSRLIDLTHSFGADTIVWPTEQDFRLVLQQAGETPGGYYYASNRLEMAEHGGTHIDAPIHFSKGGQTLDQVPIEHWLELVSESTSQPNAPVIGITASPSKISSDGKSAHGRIQNRAIVLLDTGFARYWPSLGNSIWVQS